MPLKKIVIIGPESTGKSTLCEGLAAHFHTEWVREYAREFLLKHGMDYTYEDLSTIARGQLALEEKGVSDLLARWTPLATPVPPMPLPDPILFLDTDLYVIKVWSEFVFGRCETWILDEIVTRRYDAYLLCRTDLPWVKDELREYPDLESRRRLFHIYRDLLIQQSVPWAEIGGEEDQRLEEAITAVKKLTGL